MLESPPLLVLILLFVAIAVFIEGIYLLLTSTFGKARRQTNRRLAMIGNFRSAEVALRKLQRSDGGPLEALAKRAFPALERMLVEAGMLTSVVQIIALMAILGLVSAFAVATMLQTPLPLTAVVAVVAGVVPVLVFLRLKKANRVGRFAAQLPDAIDLMVRGLQVGHPAPAAISLVAKQMADPIGTEFGIAADEVAYGRSLDEALTDMAQRVPQPDLRYLIAVIQIQHQAGGNLAEVLKNLSSVIRSRFQMFAKIRAVSAEGRMSCVVIGVIPLVMAAVITIIRPDYFAAVADHRLFWPIMGATPFMLIMGWVTMWRMVNFKV